MIQNLEALGKGVYKAIVVRSLSVVVVLMLPITLTCITFDWLLRTTQEFRWMVLVLWFTGVLFLLYHTVLPAIRCRINTLTIAHLVERKVPQLKGQLVSGVELSQSPTTPTHTKALESIKTSIDSIDSNKLLQYKYTSIPTMCAVVLLVLCAFGSLLFPTFTSIGLIRFINPHTSIKWPPRTSLESLTDISTQNVHARGTPIFLRAKNTTVNYEDGDIHASYRWHDGDGYSPWVSVLLTNQGGGIHERVLETNTEIIEFYFSTSDATTDLQSITFHTRPTTSSVALKITPPNTLSEHIKARVHVVPRSNSYYSKVEPPILKGSLITLEIQSTTPIKLPPQGFEVDWCAENIGLYTDHPPRVTNPHTGTTRIQWVMENPSQLAVQPKDHNGLRSNTPWVLDMPLGEDQMPSVVIHTPTSDRSVLKTALIDLHTSASDDIGVETIGFKINPIDPSNTTTTEPPWSKIITGTHTTCSLETQFNMEDLNSTPGMIYVLQATTSDQYPGTTNGSRQVVSTPIHIQVVGMSRFLTMLRQKLSNIREAIRFIDGHQAELEHIVRIGEWTHEDQAQQESLAKSIRAQQPSLEGILKELNSNQARDTTIEELVAYSTDSIDRAVLHATNAVYQMDSSDKHSVLKSQQDVRYELQSIVEILGEDEAAWLTIRRLERVIEIQRILSNNLSRFGALHPGLSLDKMNEEQLNSINTYSEEQTFITEDIRLFLEDLDKNTTTLAAVKDPKVAGYEEARRLAGTADPEQRSTDIAKDILWGRLQISIQNQGLLIKVLQKIHNTLSGSNKRSVKDLVRRLEKIEDSIHRLIRTQETEMTAIINSSTATSFLACGKNMLLLRNSTLAVSLDLQQTDPSLLHTINMLESAANQQAGAVADIRTAPPKKEAAVLHESNSLSLLNNALLSVIEKTNSVEQESNTSTHKFAALYNTLADREAELYLATQDLLEETHKRRLMFEARKIANLQEVIRIDLQSLVAQQTGADVSIIQEYTHNQINALSLNVVDTLVNTGASRRVLGNERTITLTLRGLAETFASSVTQEGFDSGGSKSNKNQASSNSNSRTTPPVAELELLKMMQINILDCTKEYNSNLVRGNTKEVDYQTDLAHQQIALAELTQKVLEQIQSNTDSVPSNNGPHEVNNTSIQNQYNHQQEPQNSPNQDPEGLPSLDDLLGTTGVDNQPETISPETLTNEEPLAIAAAQMKTVSTYLSASHTGIKTQRLQAEIIHQLDLAIEQAKQNSQPTQGGSSGSSDNNEFGVQREFDPTGAQPNPGDTNETKQPASTNNIVVDPILGGDLDDPNSKWGNLPPRVRDQLRQGKQEVYSSIYERMTAEYYRRLAKDVIDD